jgi:predicted anti-sigma-YlaC factor YlaD
MDEMACRELVEVVTDYLDGALGELDQRRFEAHLAECDGCRDYLDQMRRTVDAVGRVDVGRLPPELRDGLLAAFRDWRRVT